MNEIQMWKQNLRWLYKQKNTETISMLIGLVQDKLFTLGVRDKCQKCHGENRGIPGNENIVNGKILCDYCT